MNPREPLLLPRLRGPFGVFRAPDRCVSVSTAGTQLEKPSKGDVFKAQGLGLDARSSGFVDSGAASFESLPKCFGKLALEELIEAIVVKFSPGGPF